MRRRGGWLYRLMVRGVAWWCAAHGLTVVDADAVADAARVAVHLQAVTLTSGHLTRAYHVGKRVRDLAEHIVIALGWAGTRTWE